VTTLFLVRHGETDWNREHRFQGWANPSLNQAGMEQARDLAEQLAAQTAFAAVYSSPLARALQTAEVAAARLGLTAVPCQGLREIHVGEWEGLTRTEVEERYPDGFRRWLDFDRGWEEGETYEEMALRVVPALLSFAEEHPGQRVVAVTHGGPMRSAYARALGISHREARRRGPAIGNCDVARFAVRDASFRRID
jgi:2,3-bisphosphoglycerate-dependent phosphoglycerate mutase